MIGAATLVPPNTSHPPGCRRYVSYTATPVFGSATAATSVTVRREQPASVCQLGFEMYALQPLPAPLQTVSLKPRALASRLRVVPPTAVTNCDAAGNSTPKPLSPELTVIATPAWLKCDWSFTSPEYSLPPYEFEMTVAPSAAARSTAAARFAKEFVLASTRRILQFGQMALAMSRSSEISSAQPALPRG